MLCKKNQLKIKEIVLETEIIAIEALVAPERNVRMHTREQIKELARSIQMFGQIRPVIIDENNIVLAGNGLVEALKELSYSQAACLRFSALSEKEKKKLMLADNKIFSLGMDVSSIQFDFIREIGDIDIPGFDPDIINTILADTSQIAGQIAEYGNMSEESISRRRSEQEMNIGSTESPSTDNSGKQIRCPHCGEGFWIP